MGTTRRMTLERTYVNEPLSRIIDAQRPVQERRRIKIGGDTEKCRAILRCTFAMSDEVVRIEALEGNLNA